MKNPSRSMLPGATGDLLVLVSLCLGAAGLWLIVLGGSSYYLAAALVLMLCGVLFIRRSALAPSTYALLLVGSLAWSLWEVGFDWWPLAARLGVLFLVGVFLVCPWIVRWLDGYADSFQETRAKAGASWRRGGRLALGGSLVVCTAVLLFSMTQDPHQLSGALPTAQGPVEPAASTGGVQEGEWHAYGRTGFGQRYSPLMQITPANVWQLQVAWQFQTGDVRGRPGNPVETTYEVTPLKVDDRLYLRTPHQLVIALDATTGAEVWRDAPKIEGNLALQHLPCRGLSYQPPTVESSTATDGCTHGKLFMLSAPFAGMT